MKLENINIVLVQPKRSSNIGSVARAMNCMGLSNLILVEPRCQIDRTSFNLAVGSENILENAEIYYDLKEALNGSSLIAGTTKRTGKRRHNFIDLREFTLNVLPLHASSKVSILFGPEDYGLSSAHLKECQYLVYIPTNEAFGSLNLSQAVMVVAYELRTLFDASSKDKYVNREYREACSPNELEVLSRVVSDTVSTTKFPERSASSNTAGRLMEIIARANVSSFDVNFLLGIARHAQYMSSRLFGEEK